MPLKMILDYSQAEEVKDAKMSSKDMLSALNNKFYDALNKGVG